MGVNSQHVHGGGGSSDRRGVAERARARKGGAEQGRGAREEMARERGGAG